MFGKRRTLLFALLLMLLLPAFALSGCGGSSGSSSATTSGSSSGSSAPATLNATQLVENYHCGGCHATEELGLTHGNLPGRSTDFTENAWQALTGDGGNNPIGFANLLMQVTGAPMGGMDMMDNNTNGSNVPDYVIIADELQLIEGSCTGTTASTCVGDGPSMSQRSYWTPEVTSMLPNDGASAASYSLPVIITFDEAVNMTTSNITVTGPSGAVTGTLAMEPDYSMVATWTPSAPLTAGATYTVDITGVTANLTITGNAASTIAMPEYKASFTTAGTATADGQAIFYTANCAGCHVNNVDTSGNAGLLEADGSVVKYPVDGPSLGQTGNQDPGDYSLANLEIAISEMSPGSIDGTTNAIPTGGAVYETVGGTAVPPQPMIGPNGLSAAITPILQGNTTAIADVATYLQSLKPASTTTNAYLNQPSSLSRASSFLPDEGCLMCHSLTTVSGGVTTTINGLVPAEGAPNFSGVYAMNSNNALTLKSAVSGMVTANVLPTIDDTKLMTVTASVGDVQGAGAGTLVTTAGSAQETALDVVVNYLKSIAS